MSELKKIREMTGMSQGAIGNWLNMSRSMVCMIEKGERKLSKAAIFKIAAMLEKLKGEEKTARPANGTYQSVVPLAELHRQKVQKHLAYAKGLQEKLEKLHEAIPLAKSRESVINVIKNREVPGHTFSLKEEKFMELQEALKGQTKTPGSLTRDKDFLQDKIDTHLAYARLHEERWKMFLDML